jgi:two-component system, cell cycle sensor histidine kinase and response regulator CckA
MTDAPPVVLLVDDEPSLLRMMEMYLQRIGCQTVSFSQTEAAWEYARERAGGVAVAVVDVTISGMSAFELGAALLSASPGLHLILASGYPADLKELEQAAPGRVTFLHKPFSPQMLAVLLQEKAGLRPHGSKEKGIPRE